MHTVIMFGYAAFSEPFLPMAKTGLFAGGIRLKSPAFIT